MQAQNNVGIGTTSPTERLDVNGKIRMRGGTPMNGYVLVSDANGVGTWTDPATLPGAGSSLWTRSGTNLYNTNLGDNVGIGLTTPTFKLHVNGRIKTNGIRETSDRRLKRDVRELSSALSTVSQLRGVDFAWRQQDYPEQNLPGGRQLGFIAQEMETVLPQVVDTGGDGYKSVAYTQLVPLLTEAIQEQQAQIEALRSELSAQTQRVEALHANQQALQEANRALRQDVQRLKDDNANAAPQAQR